MSETIKGGLDVEYRDLVEEMMRTFYAEDIAAAVIKLYAEQGGRREVRRRTLNKAPFVPLRTKESLTRGPKRLPAIPPRPAPHVADAKASHPHNTKASLPHHAKASLPPNAKAPRPQSPARSTPGTSAPEKYGNKPAGHKGRNGRGRHNAPQGKRR